MTAPIKPRIDFAQPLSDEPAPILRPSKAFAAQQDQFVAVDPQPDVEPEGPGELAVEAALRPKRSLWRKMVITGLSLFGVSVVAQGDRKSVV